MYDKKISFGPKCHGCVFFVVISLISPQNPWNQKRMNGDDELTFPGPISQLETERWIQNMEDHMRNNTIAGKDMSQHALQYFERGAATWWRM